MKKMAVFKVVGVLSSIALLSGCLSQLKTREDLRGQTPASQTAPDVQAVESVEESGPEAVQPAYKAEERNEQIRVLHGRVEEAENNVQELRQSMIDLAKSRQEEKDAAQAKLMAYEEAIRNLEAQIESLKTQNTAASAPAPKKDGKKTSKEAGKDNSREDFHRGEGFFQQKKWKDAIVAYQKYRDDYPKGKMYPEATFQIGLCFLELGLKDESRSFFEEVRVKFPKSPLAKKAEKRLKSL